MERYGFRTVGSPLRPEDLNPLEPTEKRLQFSVPLRDEEYREVARLLEGRPDVILRRYDHEEIENLDFLRFFPFVRRIALDLYGLQSLDGIEHLPANLASISFGEMKRRLKLGGLSRFKQLQSARINGQKAAVEILSDVTTLRHLALGSVKLPNLTILRRLVNLEGFELNLGGSNVLSGIEALTNLRHLSFMMVRGLADLTPLTDLRKVETLDLNTLKHVASLPDMSQSPVRRLRLECMKGIQDLAPLLDWKHLKTCDLDLMQHLKVEDLRVLTQHPSIRNGILHVGLQTKGAKARALLGWGQDEERLLFERRRLLEPKLD